MRKSALLVIDMQNDFCQPGAPFEVRGAMNLIPKIQEAITLFRRHTLPVVYVIREHSADGSDVEITRYRRFRERGGAFVRGTPGWSIVAEIEPRHTEPVVVKKRWSAFWQTALHERLQEFGVDQVVLAGVQTPNCIRATAFDANALDYEVVVLTDATGAAEPSAHRANLADMATIGIALMSTADLRRRLPALPREHHEALDARRPAPSAASG